MRKVTTVWSIVYKYINMYVYFDRPKSDGEHIIRHQVLYEMNVYFRPVYILYALMLKLYLRYRAILFVSFPVTCAFSFSILMLYYPECVYLSEMLCKR